MRRPEEPPLHRVWRGWLAEPGPPPFDRWLADRLRDPAQRGPHSARLFAAVAFGWPALLCDRIAADAGLRAAVLAAEAPEALDRPLARLARDCPDPEATIRAWAAVPPSRFFAWTDRLSGLGNAPAAVAALADRVRALLAAHRGPQAAFAAAGVPPWFGPALTRRAQVSGWDAATFGRFLAAQTTRPPLWLRARDARDPAALDATLEALRRDGFEVEPEADAPGALQARGPRSIYESEAWKTGRVEVQDLASQLAGASLDLRAGQFVWDACAGSGGKTMQIAAELGGRGAVHASDVSARKLDETRRRARRAGFQNVRLLPWDGGDLPALPKEIALRGGFDRVLVDAPCGASGTWRRNPDARYRVALEAPAPGARADLQLALLGRTAAAVRPGGLLVYVTCSVLVEEDEDVVDAFLRGAPGFALERRGLRGCPARDADTLFAATLRRTGG